MSKGSGQWAMNRNVPSMTEALEMVGTGSVKMEQRYSDHQTEKLS